MRIAAALLITALTVRACAAAQADAVKLYNRASDLTGSLHAAGPGCVHANISVLDPSLGWRTGTIESCWAKNAVEDGAQRKKVSALKASLNMPGMHTTYLQRGNERMRWGDDGEMHFAIAALLDRAYSSYHKQARAGETLSVVTRKFGTANLQCVSIGRVRYFCGNTATGEARAIMVPGGEMDIAIDATDEANGLPYIRKATVLYFGKPVARIEVTSVERLSPSAVLAAFTPAAEARPARYDQAARVEGRLFSSPELTAPDYDRAAQATLTVGADGRARNVHVLAASDTSFGKTFGKALMNAHYAPAKQNGAAVESVVSAGVFFPKAAVRTVVQTTRDNFNPPSETYLQSWEHASEDRANGGAGTGDLTFGHTSLSFSPW